MNDIAAISRRPKVREALAGFRDGLDSAIDQIIAIQQVAAPTFAEEARARYIEERFRAIGLKEVRRDATGNVYGRLPGRSADRAPLVLSAHLDTVFPAGTDLSVRRDGPFIFGPGIGDNSTGLAGLLLIAEAIIEHQLPHAADIHFVANVGEEGLGDLCGMRAVVDHFGERATYVVIEGGLFGRLIHQAVGVRRFRIDVSAPGGHSWGGFGTTSAIHVLGRLIAAIDDLDVPSIPRTTYNVGIIEGGISINTIANVARLWLDLRSEGANELTRLVARVREIIETMNEQFKVAGDAVHIDVVQVGDRPAGSIDRLSPVVVYAETALSLVAADDIRYIVSSTDANIPLSLGYQAVCLGLTHSANAHRPDEYIDVTHLPAGLGQLLLVTLAVAQ